MKHFYLTFVFFLMAGISVFSQVTENRIEADYINNQSSYTFTSGDIIYANTTGGNLPGRNTGAVCGGATYRIQLASIILRLNSSSTNNIQVVGQSSGSALRSLSNLETSSTLNGTYTPVTGYTTSSTIDGTCGTISITDISIADNTFIRFTFNGNVNLSGFDITQFNPIVEPTVQSSTIEFSNVTNSTATLSWTSGNGSNRVVFVREGSQGSIEDPEDGLEYDASADWDSGNPGGTELGSSGYFCIYNGSESSVSLSNLNPFSNYWVRIYEYNGAGSSTDYLLSTAANNPNDFSTLADPISVSFSGLLNIGETLTGSYDYSEFPGDDEGDSVLQWFRADDEAGTNATDIVGANSLTYEITLDDEGKFLQFSVIPVDINELEGSLSVSSWQLVNSRPLASSVSVSGLLIEEEEVTGAYDYSDVDEDAEGTSTFQWYRADDASGTNSEPISGANGLTYTLQLDDLDSFIRFGVTPVATVGSSPGIEEFSDWFGPVLSGDAPLAIASGTLVESSLNTDILTITLENDTFTTDVLSAGDFSLNNAPAGLEIDAVTWVSSTEVSLNFSYDDTDFDDDVEDFSVTISAAVLSSSTTVTTQDITIVAVIEELEVTGTLDFGTLCIGQLSEAASFQVSGLDLKPGDITIEAANGYVFSNEEEGSYSETLEIPHTGGNLSPVTVFVKFNPEFAIDYENEIAVTSPGAPTQFQAVAAEGINTPSEVNAPSSASITKNTAILGGTLAEVGCSEVVEQGVYYSTTDGFANGTGTKVSNEDGPFNEGSFTVPVSGLSSGTTYYFKAFVTAADEVSYYSEQGSFTTLALDAPVATDATDVTFSSFVANWEAVDDASLYYLDVSTQEDFGITTVNPDQTLLFNGFNLTLPDWTFSNVDISSSTLRMINPASQITTAHIDLTSYSNVELNFLLRTFGGTTSSDDSNHLTISISTDNGSSWTVIGTRIGTASSLSAVTPLDLSAYSGSQIRLRFETLAATGSRGVGVRDLTVTGDETIFTPDFVFGYQNLEIDGLSQLVSGLNDNTTYYYRVRAFDGTTSDNSNVIEVTTLELLAWYPDADGDGFGVDAGVVFAVNNPDEELYVLIGGDCDDNDPTIYPGAEEFCYDGILQNCDGTLTDGCPQVLVRLRSDNCGATLTSINQTLRGDALSPGSPSVPAGVSRNGYRFRVTNLITNEVREVTTSNYVFNLGFTDIAQYNTTYSIEVAVRLNQEWMPYGQACLVTTPGLPTTQLTTTGSLASCGSTVASMNSIIRAGVVTGALAYEYEVRLIEDNVAVATQSLERPGASFNLLQFQGILPLKFGAEYEVRARVLVPTSAGNEWSEYGAVCSVFTPLASESFIEGCSAETGLSPATLNTVIYSRPSGVISLYRYRLVNEALSYDVIFESTSRAFRLSNFNAISPLTAGAVYSATVEYQLYGFFYDGKDCNITVPGGAKMVNINEQSPAVVDIFDGFKALASPNPFSEGFNINVYTNSTQPVGVAIYDMTGRLLETKEVGVDVLSTQLFGERYPSGVYNIVVTQDEEMQTVRVIKK
jgi:hypothetical protein